MKVALISFCGLFLAFSGQSQHSLNPYYVVTGGFASESNASRFADYVMEQNYPATYGFNTDHKLFYVFVVKTDDKQFALQLAYRLRREGTFKDAWIYNGPLEQAGIKTSVDGAPIAKDTVVKQDKPTATLNEEPAQGPTDDEQPALIDFETPDLETGTTTSQSVASEKPVGKPFLFKLINASTGNEVDGHVKILKTEMDTAYQAYPANEITYVPEPENGKLVVVCNLVGYKFTKRVMSYSSAAKSAKANDTNKEMMLTLKLTPVKRWDFIELERVKFFRHSVVMMPKSEPELQELASMMQNPKYKIRITGHTHRDGPVEIMTPGQSDEFFREDSANEKKESTYKELSQERADAVKRYLVSKGISENRISTKGMGNSLAVYGHSEADNRIEVEILRD